jgi:uncharacterized protein YecT (DUF1311 family)
MRGSCETIFLHAFFAVHVALLAINTGAAEGGPDLAKARCHFESADAALNKSYKALCGELGAVKLAVLRGEQRNWLAYRDEMADAQSSPGQEEVPLKRRADYWEVMAGLTEERTEFLNAYSGKNAPAGISGEYHDSYGGILLLEERKDGVAFSIEVVRGRAANEGSLDGLAIRKDGQAVFKDKPDPADSGEPCEITFTFTDGHIVKVEEKNADKYQGHNAHFDGRYFKTGKLREPIKLS